MIFEDAIKRFKSQFPELIVLRCIDYDDKHFVIEAVENLDITDYNDPYYGVDKDTGEVTGFIPSLDLDAFFDAVEERTVFTSYPEVDI